MYLHKQKEKNGDTYLSIKEKYHVPKVGSRETTVERIGYLSKRELLRLSLRLEVGASCFNHYLTVLKIFSYLKIRHFYFGT